jgi:outer membrane protein TolC
MTQSRLHVTWALCVAGAMPMLAAAESLAEAWRMALETDPALAAVQSERAAAQADHTAAARQRWPVLDVSGSYTQLQQAPILDIATPAGRLQSPKIWKDDAYAMGMAEVSLPLWTSGRISGAIGAAAAGARGAAALEAGSTADLKLAVAEAYVAVLRARRALQVAESSAASLQAHADDVQVMYDKEAVAQSDLLAARVALANATQQRLRAANALRLANASYNRRVGQPLERSPQLEALADSAPASQSLAGSSSTSTLTATASPVGTDLDRMVGRALEQRPELLAASARQQGLLQTVRAERALGWPQVVLHAGYNHLDNQILDRQDFASVGVGFQWRLFDSGQIRARTAALRSRARAAERQLADSRSLVALEVETALLDREEAEARGAVAASVVEQAEENVRIARELYGAGLATNTQVLDAEALRLGALTNRDDAAFDRLIAGFRLRRALGEL